MAEKRGLTVPRTLRIGYSGPDVAELQQLLNRRPPTSLPLLAMDGQFGPKTLARVTEFQRNNGLTVDGVVGPETWGRLSAGTGLGLESPPKLEPPGGWCGTGLPGNDGLALLYQQACLKASSSASSQAGGIGDLIAGAVRPLSAAQRATASSVYGNSIDYSNVVIANAKGAQNRACALTSAGLTGPIHILMLGTFTPDRELLIHELAHVWQSQHHWAFGMYQLTAGLSMARAWAKNKDEVANDPGIASHPGYPASYPFSAYAYLPGLAFGEYGPDQIAEQAERGVKSIVAHMRGVAPHVTDPANVQGLAVARVTDRRVPGVV
jgi:hypothetical protein